METGIVKSYNGAKGYGFVIPDGKQEREDDQFFHVSQCQAGYNPERGDKVSFKRGMRRDRPCALEVKPIE